MSAPAIVSALDMGLEMVGQNLECELGEMNVANCRSPRLAAKVSSN